jgi:hypothetical protein
MRARNERMIPRLDAQPCVDRLCASRTTVVPMEYPSIKTNQPPANMPPEITDAMMPCSDMVKERNSRGEEVSELKVVSSCARRDRQIDARSVTLPLNIDGPTLSHVAAFTQEAA